MSDGLRWDDPTGFAAANSEHPPPASVHHTTWYMISGETMTEARQRVADAEAGRMEAEFLQKQAEKVATFTFINDTFNLRLIFINKTG